jgi:hypothetical protein
MVAVRLYRREYANPLPRRQPAWPRRCHKRPKRIHVHFRDFIQNQNSPGLILIPQTRVSIRQAVDGLILLWEVLEATDLENRVCVFPSLVIY